MAVIVFSGGDYLVVPQSARNVADTFTNGDGITSGWVEVACGEANVLVNPSQIAFLAEDTDIQAIRVSSGHLR